MPTFRLDLGYDGSAFRGYARQQSVRTVQGELESALNRVLGHPVETSCAGRTDAGVHARGQVAAFTDDADIDPARLARSLNGLVGPEIVVTAVSVVDAGFDARFSAAWRAYRYQVLNAPSPDPLRRHVTWHVSDPLDLDAMNRAAAGFVGEHDFASFCRRAEARSTVRRVLEASWVRADDLAVFSVRATAFCHQMVRSLVGFCVDAGRGRVSPDTVSAVLAAGDRSAARPIAPPHGLILWEVGY